MIIVNADDFGRDDNVNRAIIDSISNNICSSTTIMPTADAFEAACSLVAEKKLADKVGVHLVLVKQKPLTDEIIRCPRFCDDNGLFRPKRAKGGFLRITSTEKLALAAELRSQIKHCRSHGLSLTHADSHYHMHEEPALAPVFSRICKEEDIPFIRLARNCGTITTFYKRMYRIFLNARFRSQGLAYTDYFGSTADFEFLIKQKGGWQSNLSMEIMVHPRYENDVLIDDTDGRPMENLGKILDETEQPVPFGNTAS